MRKKIIIVLILLANLISLSACYSDIDQQIMVSGLAIDEGKNGKKYHVSVETVSPSSGEIESNLLEFDGDTIFQTLRNMVEISSKKLYFGHCKAIFISEKLAKQGIGELLDFILRDHEARAEMDVIITKGCKAKDAINVDGVFSPIIAYKVDELFDSKDKGFGNAPSVQTYEVYNEINTEGVAPAIPAVEIVNVEDAKDLRFCGTAVFDKDKLVGYLDARETKNLSIIDNEIKTGLLTYESGDDKNAYTSYEIFGNKSKRDLEFNSDNNVKVNISVKTKVGIGETQSVVDFTKSDQVKKMEQELESKMEEDLYKLISKSQTELGSDIFGIGRQIYRDYPDIWEKYKDNWKEMYKSIDFTVDCKVTITGSGSYKKGPERSSG